MQNHWFLAFPYDTSHAKILNDAIDAPLLALCVVMPDEITVVLIFCKDKRIAQRLDTIPEESGRESDAAMGGSKS